MKTYTEQELKSALEKKLSHNFGVTPQVASDELFYKASAGVLVDIMNDRRTEFKKSAEKQDVEYGEPRRGLHRKIGFAGVLARGPAGIIIGILCHFSLGLRMLS